jgi:putative endonuclease
MAGTSPAMTLLDRPTAQLLELTRLISGQTLRRPAKPAVSKDGARMGALYIPRCADGSYYTGTTRAELEQRVAEHQAGTLGGYTSVRRPVELVLSEYLDTIADAMAAERRVKGWSRTKKEALMVGKFQRLSKLAKRRGTGRPHGSRRIAARCSSP